MKNRYLFLILCPLFWSYLWLPVDAAGAEEEVEKSENKEEKKTKKVVTAASPSFKEEKIVKEKSAAAVPAKLKTPVKALSTVAEKRPLKSVKKTKTDLQVVPTSSRQIHKEIKSKKSNTATINQKEKNLPSEALLGDLELLLMFELLQDMEMFED